VALEVQAHDILLLRHKIEKEFVDLGLFISKVQINEEWPNSQFSAEIEVRCEVEEGKYISDLATSYTVSPIVRDLSIVDHSEAFSPYSSDISYDRISVLKFSISLVEPIVENFLNNLRELSEPIRRKLFEKEFNKEVEEILKK
jgi:hypothetical protein